MKLLMVTREVQADQRFGLGKSLLPIISGMSARGHTVQYLCQTSRSAHSAEFCRRLHGWLSPMFRWIGGPDSDSDAVLQALLERVDMGRLAAKVARRDGFSHVHLHDPWIALGFMLAQRLSFRPPGAWGVTEHGFGSYARAVHQDGVRQGTRLASLLRRLERRITLRAGWVIAPTEAALTQLERDLAVHPQPPRWHAIPHPLPVLQRWTRGDARARLGWAADGRYVLGVGRMAPLKRFDLMVRAVARSTTPADPLRLVILGDGDAAALGVLGRACGLAHDIEFAVTDDVGLYLAAADLYVSTSSTESFGMANLEAVVAGTRAVCTAVGGVPEVVADAATLVPLDEEAIAAAIRAALNEDADARSRWLAAAQARVARWPRQAEIIDRYIAAYSAPGAAA